MDREHFIGRIDGKDLVEAALKGEGDSSSEKLLDSEKEYIAAWRKKRSGQEDSSDQDSDSDKVKDNLVGLGLSGGGIRSATFSLGVMQALENSGLYQKLDYLSTVSGGGYIGSSVTWLSKCMADVKGFSGKLPFGTGLDFNSKDPDSESKATKAKFTEYLRSHGNYLTPGNGITKASFTGVILRGSFLTFLVWFLVSTLAMYSLIFVSRQIPVYHLIQNGSGLNGLELLFWHVLDIFYVPDTDTWNKNNFPDAIKLLIRHPISLNLLIGSLLGAILFLFLSIIYSIITWFSGDVSVGYKRFYSMKSNESSMQRRYLGRRIFEKFIGRILGWTVILFVLGSLPTADELIKEQGGFGAALSGLGAGVWGFFKTKSAGKVQAPLGLIASVGSFLFIYGAVLLSFQIADNTLVGTTEVQFPILGTHSLAGVAFFISFWAFMLGVMVNLNYISIHRYYRDRLMESFLPDPDKAEANSTGAAIRADKAKLHNLQTKTSANSPYHIINTNLVLVDSEKRTYKMRGGDNFILSPLYCGSNATGWRRTEDYMSGKMNLPTAMAISGAAANPNTGVGGKGVTRNRALSLLLSLLNIRLGYWIPNPGASRPPLLPPNHFFPGIYEILDKGFSEDNSFLQISDGGHFENNGFYELVRRKCKLIIICDAGCDKEFSFSDFITSWKRVESDFGARIEFANGETQTLTNKIGNFRDMVPQDLETRGYPRKDDQFAERSHIEGNITYADGSEGTLIFIKTTIIKGMDERVLGYKALNQDFPDETTADQFFSEEQFEAYRRLGFQIGGKMIEDTELSQRIEKMQLK